MDDNAAIEIYKIQHDRFKHTKDLQWKINLSFWTLLAAGVYYSDKFAATLSLFQMICVVVIFFVAQVIFSYKTQKSMEADKKIMSEILEQLNHDKVKNISVNVRERAKDVRASKQGNGWILFHLFMSASLLLLLLFRFLAVYNSI